MLGSCMHETRASDPHLFWLLLSHMKPVQMFNILEQSCSGSFWTFHPRSNAFEILGSGDSSCFDSHLTPTSLSDGLTVLKRCKDQKNSECRSTHFSSEYPSSAGMMGYGSPVSTPGYFQDQDKAYL